MRKYRSLKKGHGKKRDSLKLKNKSKSKNNKSKLKNNKEGKYKGSQHKLNHNASALRGVAKIFKGFKLGHRRSAAYKLMHKKSHLKSDQSKVKSNKVQLKNARVVNKKSFAQLAANKYFNKYKKYKLKKARIHFHPSNKFKKFK